MAPGYGRSEKASRPSEENSHAQSTPARSGTGRLGNRP